MKTPKLDKTKALFSAGRKIELRQDPGVKSPWESPSMSKGKTLIYSCVFFNENYIQLLDLLVKSYKLYGRPSRQVHYLVICNPSFRNKIRKLFKGSNITVKIWSLPKRIVRTKFEACYSRLKIFDWFHINLYKKILYLDCDILITNPINRLLNFPLENKLYALREGYTTKAFWGGLFFDEKEHPRNRRGFSSGVLLFNNNIIMKDLFSKILTHIEGNGSKPPYGWEWTDQPFIVYHAIKNDLYNNMKLIGMIRNINNFNELDKFQDGGINQSVTHFPGGVGAYKCKFEKMTEFMKVILDFKIMKSLKKAKK